MTPYSSSGVRKTCVCLVYESAIVNPGTIGNIRSQAAAVAGVSVNDSVVLYTDALLERTTPLLDTVTEVYRDIPKFGTNARHASSVAPAERLAPSTHLPLSAAKKNGSEKWRQSSWGTKTPLASKLGQYSGAHAAM